MANCTKDTNYPLADQFGTRIRTIRYTSDRKTLELVSLGSASVECSRNLDSNDYLGVKIENGNVVFTDAISGLGTNLTVLVSDNPAIGIIDVGGGTLNVIGVDDISMGFASNRINVRYDAATNSIKIQL